MQQDPAEGPWEAKEETDAPPGSPVQAAPSTRRVRVLSAQEGRELGSGVGLGSVSFLHRRAGSPALGLDLGLIAFVLGQNKEPGSPMVWRELRCGNSK